SRFLAHVHYRQEVQVGPKTHQRVDKEVETRDTHIPSSMRRMSFQSADWGAVCYDPLGAISDNIYGGRAYILEMIGGYLMPDLSRNLVHLKWLLKLVDFRAVGEFSWWSTVLATLWNHSASYVGILTVLEDIRLLLNQRSEAQTPYEDPKIQVVISDEFFQNLNIWHVKVPWVNYATVEIHQMDRLEHIEMWKNRYDHLPTREPIIVPELVCVLDYMPWFRIHGKPYLLSEEERRR
ncbi:hypothetical protein Goshw_019670, partial [Gossypium schwendimanii]|nr:hypothetical protein [Gossypium schwendimanii]